MEKNYYLLYPSFLLSQQYVASLIGKSFIPWATFSGNKNKKVKDGGLRHCPHQHPPLKQNNPPLLPSCSVTDLSVSVGKGRGPPLSLSSVLLVMVCGAGLWSFPVASIYNFPTDPGLFTGKSRFRVDTGVTIKSYRFKLHLPTNISSWMPLHPFWPTKTTRGEEMGFSVSSALSNSCDYQLESFKCIMKWNFSLG